MKEAIKNDLDLIFGGRCFAHELAHYLGVAFYRIFFTHL